MLFTRFIALVATTATFVFASFSFAQSSTFNENASSHKTSTAQTKVQKEQKSSSWDDEFLKSFTDDLCSELDAFAKKNQFDTTFRVKTTERFVFVYDVSDAYVEWIAALLEEVAKAFEKFLDKVQFDYERPREPMTVFVFATREEFDAYAVEVRGKSYLQLETKPTGFYTQRLNRSIVYDRTGGEVGRADLEDSGKRAYSRRKINAEARSIRSRENADSNTSTIVHEATHQLSYNYGLFSPNFRAPDWAVEGLATMFEEPDPDSALGWRFRNVFPVNRSRLETLRRYAEEEQTCPIVDEIVVSDRFAETIDDAGYAAAWAMFFYCYRKRGKELAEFLELIASKRPGSSYSEQERIRDFEKCFGARDEFKKQFARYIRSL